MAGRGSGRCSSKKRTCTLELSLLENVHDQWWKKLKVNNNENFPYRRGDELLSSSYLEIKLPGFKKVDIFTRTRQGTVYILGHPQKALMIYMYRACILNA